MRRRDIISELNIDKEEIDQEVEERLESLSNEDFEQKLDESVRDFHVNTVLDGRVVSITDDEVMIDVGYKSEGVVDIREWRDRDSIEVGDTVEVLLEDVEDDAGIVQLSKRKADRIRSWERITGTCEEDDVVTGRVMRKIKGGLLLDIGVPVFLPASQVDIRRPGEIADYIGYDLTAKILKIDENRRNIVVSRRQLIESQREVMQERLFPKLVEDEIRTGKVKNIVDFGAFVDLGGIDGLLHITDMSWGRISHPSEMVAIDDEIEVKILNVDQEKGKVALGLKQKTPSPWENIAEKYPVGSTVTGEVVNLMSYGAFVKLEEGVEGLVHISEMSWTRRINHPSEVVAIGDIVDVVVLDIDIEKEQISLGMKQTEKNPWETVKENYPPETKVVGQVRNLTSYGAFIEIEEGIDGLLHVNDMSWTRKVNHPSEVVQKGETVETMVLEVSPEKRRVALGLKQLEPDPWEEEIPGKYQSGDLARGRISKLTSFGAFVKLEDGLEGLLHVSEMSDKKIDSPEEIVAEGDVVDVRILRVDPDERKIGLSLREQPGLEEEEEAPGIVLLSDQLEEAENPEEMVEEAMDEAPQHQESSGETDISSGPPRAASSNLDIPREVAGSTEEEVSEETEDEGEIETETEEEAEESPEIDEETLPAPEAVLEEESEKEAEESPEQEESVPEPPEPEEKEEAGEPPPLPEDMPVADETVPEDEEVPPPPSDESEAESPELNETEEDTEEEIEEVEQEGESDEDTA